MTRTSLKRQMQRRQTLRDAAVSFAFIACLPLEGHAQSGMSRAEAAQLYTAAGFVIANDRPVNRCGQPARPNVTFVDLNADKRPEALFVDADARCYAPSGRYFAVLVKEGSRWRALVSGNGSIQALPSRTAGWLDMRVSGSGCARNFSFVGRAYAPAGGCAGETLAGAPPGLPMQPRATSRRGGNTPPPAAAPATPGPPPDSRAVTAATAATATLPAGDEAAAFRAAGFKKRGNVWRSGCEDPGTASYSPGRIEQVVDLNGDGLPEVVLGEGGTFCYGNPGQAYWLVTKQADGRWKLMTQRTGIAEFLKTKGAQGWPDISVGGPGFCFPVERWDGRAYKLQRWEYEGKACKPPR
ncbi:MAG: hypothetical protein ABIP61_16880 [Burkholderiaceae bacterium]